MRTGALLLELQHCEARMGLRFPWQARFITSNILTAQPGASVSYAGIMHQADMRGVSFVLALPAQTCTCMQPG